MKKSLTFLILSVLMVCIFAGCNGENEPAPPTLPQYGTESQSGTIPEQTTVPESEPQNENGFYPVEREQPVVSPDDEAYLRRDNTFTGFSGVEILSETPKLGNSQQNLTGYATYYGIVCADGDDVYYTALGYDNFLHKKSGGTDEVFLEKTVWGINIIGGQMYCIMNSEAPVQNLQSYSSGDLYRVDLETGEMSLLLATKATSLAAFEDRLCFIYDNGLNDTFYNRVYECDLNGENITEHDGAFLGFIGEYSVGFDEFGQNSCLIHETTGEKIRFTDSNLIYNFTTEGKYCYYQSGGAGFYRLDPSSGETIPMMPDKSFNTITYKVSETETVTHKTGGHFIGGHYILDGNAYLVDEEFAFRVTPDNKTEVYHTPLTASLGWHYTSLFGDGEILYSVKCNLSLKQYKLVGLQFTDEEYAEGIKTVKEIELL